MSTELAIPTPQELSALSDRDLFALDAALDEVQPRVRELCDAKLRHWVEVEGKTQTEIAEMVGRSVSRINQRCIGLGLQPKSNRGRPRISSAGNSDPDPEVIEAEVIEDDAEEVTGEIVTEPAPPSAYTKSDRHLDRLVAGLSAWDVDSLRDADLTTALPADTTELQDAIERAIRGLKWLRSRLEKA